MNVARAAFTAVFAGSFFVAALLTGAQELKAARIGFLLGGTSSSPALYIEGTEGGWRG